MVKNILLAALVLIAGISIPASAGENASGTGSASPTYKDFSVVVNSTTAVLFNVEGFNLITVSTTGAWSVTTGASAFYCADVNGATTGGPLNFVRSDTASGTVSSSAFTGNIVQWSMLISSCHDVKVTPAGSFSGTMTVWVHASNGDTPLH